MNDTLAGASPVDVSVGRPVPERAHSSATVLLSLLANGTELDRREVRDASGALLAVEVRRGHEFVAAWGADFDRALASHPVVLARSKTPNVGGEPHAPR